MSDNDPIPYILVDRPPKPGDRVRVEFDATYVRTVWLGNDVVSVDELDGPSYPTAVPSGSVKVIVEPVGPVKVGDVIDAIEAEVLPGDSVVTCDANGRTYVRPAWQVGLWHGDTRMAAAAGGPCRVLHIGGIE